MTSPDADGRFTVFVIAAEESGDLLGARLMRALHARLGTRVRFLGVGGGRMEQAGLRSLFAMHDIGLHGIGAVIASLPRLVLRMRRIAAEIVRANPDVLVLIDAPAFNLRVARLVRRRNRAIAIVDYVSPTVWAYHPGRAPWMARFVDQVMAILPFEPRVHSDLGGPPCVYVGHPLLERLDELRPDAGERRPIEEADRPVLVVLPGSRRGEIARLMDPFGAAVAGIAERFGDVEVVLPAIARLVDEIRVRAAAWPVRPRIVEGEEAKLAAFRRGHAALAASGTVTLELALAGVPMVVGYRLDAMSKPARRLVEARSVFKRFLSVRSIVLANLVLDAAVVPEFLDRECTPDRLCDALLPLLAPSPERTRQIAAFNRLDNLMAIERDSPSGLAADVVLETVRARRLHAALAQSA